MNWVLRAIEITFLILLPSTLILISGSHFHTYFFFSFSSTYVFYFILLWHFQILAAVLILSQSICCWASVSGCPTLCHVLSTGGTQWTGGKSIPLLLMFDFPPRLCTFVKTKQELVLGYCQFAAFFQEIDIRMCDI